MNEHDAVILNKNIVAEESLNHPKIINTKVTAKISSGKITCDLIENLAPPFYTNFMRTEIIVHPSNDNEGFITCTTIDEEIRWRAN